MERKKTSIHFEACNVSKSQLHNSRKQDLDYIFKELSDDNESMYLDPRSLKDIEKEIQLKYKEKIDRKMPSNTVPIREAVVVIDENTTMFDLQKLADEVEKLFKWQPLQIHIHRDEGYVKSAKNKTEEKVLNLHAHLVFNCQDQEKGKMHKIDKIKLSKLQTITADVLDMQRGQSSNRKHLKSLEFKIQKEKEKLAELSKKIDEHEEKEKFYEKALQEIIQKYRYEQKENENLKKDFIEEKERLEKEIQGLRNTQNKIDENIQQLDRLEKEGLEAAEEVYETMYSNRVKRKRGF